MSCACGKAGRLLRPSPCRTTRQRLLRAGVSLSDERFVSYAQNLEDVLLWRALSGSAGAAGFYIDVGASDPTALSVTRAFYDRGWRGINVEPLPEQAARLREARPRDLVVEAAIGAAAQRTAAFHRVTKDSQTGLSTLDASEAEHHRAEGADVDLIEVAVTTLAELCREHVSDPIHFLKIDVEGAEAAALAGADLHAHRPWIILVEATQPLEAAEADLAWQPALLAAGYEFVWFDGLNRFYLAQEHRELARHFRVPPNVFDHYTVYDAPLNDHLAETVALSHRRAETVEWLQAELANLRRRLDTERAVEAAPVPEPQAAPSPVLGSPVLGSPVLGSPVLALAAPAPAPEPHGLIDLPFTGSGVGRRIGKQLYRLIRPVARPIAWRSRQFITGELREELAGLRERLDQLVARPVQAPAASADPAMAAAMERLLLTLALQDARDPSPPGLAPAPHAERACAGLSNPRSGG